MGHHVLHTTAETAAALVSAAMCGLQPICV
jgi:hypothetical protein